MTVPQASVFQGITEEEWLQMGPACSMKWGLYEKGRTIFRQGEPAAEMGVVLSGGVCIESVDLWGDRSILSHVGAGQVFGETYALTGGPLPVAAVAAENSQILTINVSGLLRGEICVQHLAEEAPGQPGVYLCPEESGPFRADLLHQRQDHPRQAADLSFRPGGGGRQLRLFHPL